MTFRSAGLTQIEDFRILPRNDTMGVSELRPGISLGFPLM